MANIPLQSISFPGLSDKYTTPTVDATLTQTGAAADAKKTGDEIGAIKNDLNHYSGAKRELTDGSDLNDIAETGIFYLSSSNTYVHTPTSNYGGMLLTYYNALHRNYQIFYAYIENALYIRHYTGSWTDWYPLASQADVDTLSSDVAQAISFINSIKPNYVQYNYFDYSHAKDNTNIGSNGAEVSGMTDYCASDYISMSSGTVFYGGWFGDTARNPVLYRACLYNASKVFQERVDVTGNVYTASANGYVRFVIYKNTANISTDFTVSIGERLDKYYPAGLVPAKQNAVSITKISSTNFVVDFGSCKTQLVKTTGTNVDNWNLREIANNGNVIVPYNNDYLGPVIINNNADYIGGTHGMETTNNVQVSVNGETLTLDQIADTVGGNNLSITLKSSVYDRDNPSTKVFDRLVIVQFAPNKIKVFTSFTCTSACTLKRATNGGMISAENPIINSIAMPNYYGSAPSDQINNKSKSNTFAVISTAYGSISVENLIGHNNEYFEGYLHVMTSESPVRSKVYLDTYKSGEYALSVGDIITGAFEYTIN